MFSERRRRLFLPTRIQIGIVLIRWGRTKRVANNSLSLGELAGICFCKFVLIKVLYSDANVEHPTSHIALNTKYST